MLSKSMLYYVIHFCDGAIQNKNILCGLGSQILLKGGQNDNFAHLRISSNINWQSHGVAICSLKNKQANLDLQQKLLQAFQA